jgi:AcrR family transcriptional regulator
MGRKPSNKERAKDPQLRSEWAEALLPYLRSRGIKRQSMDDIAAFLGVSKKTLYRHFDSRHELYEFIVEKILGDLRLTEILYHSELDLPRRYLALMQQAVRSSAKISTVMLADLKNYFPKLWQRVLHFHQEMERQIQDLIAQGVSEGYFEQVHPAIVSAVNQETIGRILDPDFLNSNGITLKQALKDFFHVQLFGLVRSRELSGKFVRELEKEITDLENIY